MQKTSVALGLFDGIHLGHRAVLREASRLADSSQLRRIVFTFPSETAVRKNSGGFLYPTSTRNRILEQDFAFSVFCENFETIRDISGEEFAKSILCETLHAACVTCGKNFRFGKNATWNAEDLKNFGKKYQFQVSVIPTAVYHDQVISSTEIRKLLTTGNIQLANQFLGQPYQILAPVVHGNHLGRTIGFPTVNQLFLENQLIPKFGVYQSCTTTPDGKQFHSVTNIGMKPTVHYQGIPLAETYIQDFSGDLYDQIIRTELLVFLRAEKKFDSIAELTEQLRRDLQGN